MKKLFILSLFAGIVSCTNDHNRQSTDKNADSLQSNPHGIPTHVDTTTHEDGLSNQSPVPDTDATH